MSVAMIKGGTVGWVSDRTGYRHVACGPESGRHWPPPLPEVFGALTAQAVERAGFGGFAPDACLINRYEPGARLSLHQEE
jgi:DNA oxidative demethylase